MDIDAQLSDGIPELSELLQRHFDRERRRANERFEEPLSLEDGRLDTITGLLPQD